MKKIISLVISLALVISAFSGLTVSAASYSVGVCSNTGTYKITYDRSIEFTVQSPVKPDVDSHNGHIMRVWLKRVSGTSYTYGISSIGKIGASTGVYGSVRGKNQKLLFVGKVGPVSLTCTQTTDLNTYINTVRQFELHTPYKYLVGTGNAGVATVSYVLWDRAGGEYTYQVNPRGIGSTGVYATFNGSTKLLFVVTVSATEDDPIVRSDMLTLMNNERAKVNSQPLTETAALDNVATIRAKELATLYDHTRPSGTMEDLLTGIDHYGYGEIIVYCDGGQSAAGAFQLWMNSQDHKEAIETGGYDQTGIGYYDTPDGFTRYYAVEFVQSSHAYDWYHQH